MPAYVYPTWYLLDPTGVSLTGIYGHPLADDHDRWPVPLRDSSEAV
jgi:hypothetical protein